MPVSRAFPLWAGRTMAFIGIMLVAINLRTAAVAFSPIIGHINADIPLDGLRIGIIAAVPAVAFSLSAFFGAATAKKLGLERLLALSIVFMVIGHLLRAVSTGYLVILVGTTISLGAAGIGNVLLPPLVKRYFNDRVGPLTALYALVLAVSAALPAALAAPVADALGWRASIGMWAILAMLSLVPWLSILAQHRRERVTSGDEAPELAIPDTAMLGKIWHSKMAWALAVVFSSSAAHFYTAAAWFPQLMVNTANVNHIEAGGLLAICSLMGVPAALAVPILAVRLKNVSWMILAGLIFFSSGYLGLLLAPAAASILWVALVGLGALIFPVSLVLINLRSRTEAGSVALSGFVQGFGYAIAAAIPLLVGVLHDFSGGWTAPMIMVLVVTVLCIGPAVALRRPKFIEDDLVRIAGKPIRS
jgi:CP family cyanate transporter-like MFS transporter